MNQIKLLYIDLFCGAGGTSTGVEYAQLHGEKCAKVIACVNHDPNAILSHAANHPDTLHFTEDIRTLELSGLVQHLHRMKLQHPDAHVVLWASLECTNFSRAKGGQPRDADSRTLAEHLFRYIEAIDPDYIQIENVEEFMMWGELDENGKPVSNDQGSDYLRWVRNVQSYGYNFDWRILNAADFGAYTSRKRFFGQFARRGYPIAFPIPTYAKNGDEGGLFHQYHKWKPVREVLDFKDEGESIFVRKKPLCEKTLERIYAGLIKFVAGMSQKDFAAFIVKYNSMNSSGHYTAPSIDEPSPTVTTRDRISLVRCFIDNQYGNGTPTPISAPCPTIPTNPKQALVNPKFIVNYRFNNTGSSVEEPAPTICTVGQIGVASCDKFLMNPQFASKGGSVDKPCFTLIARMDKMPPYLVCTEQGEVGIAIFDDDSPMTRKIKEFMAIYNVVDIKMRMLKVSELKKIMGFPESYVLIGTQSEQKKFIGNAVEVNMSRVLCEALCQKLEKQNRIAV